MWHLKDHVLEELSGGELQLVLIAKALALKPKVLLLDEPLNNLDVKNQLAILQLLRRLLAEATIVAVLHDINMAYRYADYIIFMKKALYMSQVPQRKFLQKRSNKRLSRRSNIEAGDIHTMSGDSLGQR